VCRVYDVCNSYVMYACCVTDMYVACGVNAWLMRCVRVAYALPDVCDVCDVCVMCCVCVLCVICV